MARKSFTIDGTSHFVDETTVDVRVRISLQDESAMFDLGAKLQAECEVIICGEKFGSWKVRFTLPNMLRVKKHQVTDLSGQLAEKCYNLMVRDNLRGDMFVALTKNVLRQYFKGYPDDELDKLKAAIQLV